MAGSKPGPKRQCDWVSTSFRFPPELRRAIRCTAGARSLSQNSLVCAAVAMRVGVPFRLVTAPGCRRSGFTATDTGPLLIRFPADVLDAASAYAAQHGMTVTDLVAETVARDVQARYQEGLPLVS